MRVVVIPDVHDRCAAVNRILIAEQDSDVRVYLGDWFDSWRGDVVAALDTANFLALCMQEEKDVFILGNHDMSYLFGHRCSGWSRAKENVVREVITPELASRFVLHHWVDEGERPWLLSHAGFSNYLIPADRRGIWGRSTVESKQALIDSMCERALVDLRNKQSNIICEAGFARGGGSPVGGINWCDWDEFYPVARINQLVGHTYERDKLRQKNHPTSLNYCIDTGNHYAVIENGKLTVKEIPDVVEVLNALTPKA